MRPNEPVPPTNDGSPDDTPHWERDPYVAQALSDAMAVPKSSATWEHALAAIRARLDTETTSGFRLDYVSPELSEPVRGDGNRGLFLGIPARRLGTSPRQWIGAAAFLFAGAGLVALFLGKAPKTHAAHTYRTTTAQRATITLVDGSRVTLAPQSTITIAQAFGSTMRTVRLDGEAYFEVAQARDAHAPFLVQSGRVSTRVLGTAFMVRHYTGDRAVRVAVTAGKVLVTAQTPRRPSVVLTPGQTSLVTDSTAITESMDATQPTAWLAGRLVFRKAPATEVLATLSRWYDYEFRLADSTLATRLLTAALSANSSQDALSTLKLLLDVDLTFDGNVVTLVPRTARRTSPPSRRVEPSVLTSHTTEVGR